MLVFFLLLLLQMEFSWEGLVVIFHTPHLLNYYQQKMEEKKIIESLVPNLIKKKSHFTN